MLIITISTILCVICSVLLIFRLINQLKETKDIYQRHGKKNQIIFKLFKPIILILASVNKKFWEDHCNKKYKKKLIISGNPYKLIPVEFYSVKEISSALGFGFGIFIIYNFQNLSIWLVSFFTVLLFFLPDLWLKEIISKRKHLIFNSLSFYIDHLNLSIKAGLSFFDAIKQVVKNGTGPLRDEFELLLIDLNTSPIRRQAFEKLNYRCDMYEVKAFISALIQVEEQGNDISEVLECQSEIRRDERFKKAEELAQKAPVKMIFPIIFFIIPTVILIIFVPIYLRFMVEWN